MKNDLYRYKLFFLRIVVNVAIKSFITCNVKFTTKLYLYFLHFSLMY